MTMTHRDPGCATDDIVLTPRARTVARRAAFWLGVAVVCILVVAASLFLTRGGASAACPRPDEPGADGAKAVAEVLRSQGVDVIIPDGYDEAVAEAQHPRNDPRPLRPVRATSPTSG